MAPIQTTYQTYQAKGLREDLSDVIYDISPTETPFMSNAGRGTAKAVLKDWQTDALANPDGNNAQVEGDESTFPAAAPTVRYQNVCQISNKTVLVSGTLEAVDKAGRDSELAYQLSKRSAELKRDMETILLQNQGGDLGTATTPRKLAGMGAWVKSNVNMATDGVNPTYTSGLPTSGRTDGTARALSEALLRDVLQQMFTRGADVENCMAMFGPINRMNASLFKGVAAKTYYTSSRQATAIIGSSDVYVSDWGSVGFVANRFQRERDAWVIDPSMVSVDFLRGFRQSALGKSGDAEKRLLLAEYTLKVNNEQAHGLIADLNNTVQTIP